MRWTDRQSDIGDRLPDWMRSIRFRLTALYSVVLFGLAALVVGGLYLGLARALDDQPVSRTYEVRELVGRTPEGRLVVSQSTLTDLQGLEELANERAVDALGRYSLAALGLLFLASLGVGWVVAGRVLDPIGRITDAARRIQATDLTERIALTGPNDELHRLAGTIDDLLGRIDEAFEGQRRFIHEASHELRNPLAVMRTNLDVALADPEASAAELRQTAGVVARSTERMSRLVDDLLTYARQERPPMEREPVEMAGVLGEAVEEFSAPARTRDLRIVRHAPDEVWCLGDRDALRQAVANLVGNAVRLAPPGSAVRLTAGRKGPWVWAAVADEGPGIPADQKERVFERFWRADSAAARQEGRSGLGLTIVRRIAEAHGGQVRLVSEEGAGSTFALWLPATDADT
ncbi:hypothetical protein BH24ACT3_BH24ACT3_04990 [soil metagenome]